MPNSSDSFQLIKEDENEINLKNSSPPISDYSSGYPKTVLNKNLDKDQRGSGNSSSSNNAHLEQEQERERDDENDDQEIKAKTEVGGKSEVADDDEGFKTPTSLDQRIPVPIKCPPAPRKPRPPSSPSRKRKFSRRRNVVKLDFTRDVESFFPTIIREDLNNKKMKKSSDDDDK